MKTSNLIGPALDWAVTKALGITEIGAPEGRTFESEFLLMHDAGDFNYSTDWNQGGPIIVREKIECTVSAMSANWVARIKQPTLMHDDHRHEGPTPLIAAMRCYVASKLGDTVDVPEELQ
jgi:hypothetical protein